MKSQIRCLCKIAPIAFALLLSISGCKDNSSKNPNPTLAEDATFANTTLADERIALVVTEDNISLLNNYTNLKEVDLSGSTCYKAILDYMEAQPQVKVIYTVSFGDTTVKNDLTELSLLGGTYEYEALMENLEFLPDVTSLTLVDTHLTSGQLTALKDFYPDITIDYTVDSLNVEIDINATELNLSALDASQAADIAPILGQMPNLTYIELNGSDGTSHFSIADVKLMKQYAINAAINYSFDLFGKTVSTSDTALEYVQVNIGNDGAQTIRDALDILPKCNYLLLDDCGIDNETVASIRDDYSNVKVVWRIHVWERSWLTDTEILRAVYHVDDSNSEPFKYLTQVKYMDLGHNTDMTDLSFIAYMPDLEMAILSGSPITDLTPLANCKKLTFLEIAWCGWVQDISPLASCSSLKYLNIGHTRVSDLSPLNNLSLELLSYVNSGNRVGMTASDWQQIQAQHPDCLITYEPLADNNATPYSIGWRYKAEGGYTECYKKIREVFNYDYLDQLIQQQK